MKLLLGGLTQLKGQCLPGPSDAIIWVRSGHAGRIHHNGAVERREEGLESGKELETPGLRSLRSIQSWLGRPVDERAVVESMRKGLGIAARPGEGVVQGGAVEVHNCPFIFSRV